MLLVYGHTLTKCDYRRRTDWIPHAHSANWAPCGQYLFVCEKGTDRIIVYAFDSATGKITNHSETMVTIGGGARHLAVSPDGKHVYVNEEAGAKITSYGWDAEAGVLTPKQSLTTLPAGFEEEVFTAECSLNEAGDVLYVANRVWPPVPGSDNGSLATFGVDADGAMEARGHVTTRAICRCLRSIGLL